VNLTLITAAVATATGFGAAWQVQAWRMDAAELERVTAAANARSENERLAHRAATKFETDRSTNATRTRTITVEVEKIIDRPVYRNICIDADGLQLIAAAIARRDPASQPGHALPGPAAAE
jgi:hypothetical protein